MTAPHDATLEEFEAALADRGEAFYEFTLFVSGASDLSARAIANARYLCELHLPNRYHLSVVDVHADPAAATERQVLAVPTLMRHHPLPIRKLVGDLSQTARVLTALDLPPAVDGSARAPLMTMSAAVPGRPTGDPRTTEHPSPSAERTDMRLVEIVDGGVDQEPAMLSRADAIVRMHDAEDTLRAIGAGEIDAFVVSDGASTRRVFTLSTADRPYRIFVENMLDGAATLSSNGLVLYANRRLSEILSCSREAIVGAPLAMFVVGDGAAGVAELRGPAGLGATVELDLHNGDQVAVPVLVKTSPLDVDGDRLMCLTVTDLSAQKVLDREISRLGAAQEERMADLQMAQAALTLQATHDALTGLPNRALLVDRIGQALSHAKRSGRCTVVLFVDLDRFKQVNDTQGHAAGDVLLKRVGQQLVSVLRPMDTVARIGGDEFVVLAPDVDNHLHAVDISNRLVAELCHRPGRSGDGDTVSASVGVSVSVGGDGTAESLLNEADSAMYKAKSLGGGRVEVFDAALGQQVQRRSVAQLMLKSALNDHRVINYYQPLINLGTRTLVGFEALARIAEPDGSILSPAIFIPVAEDTGLVVPLGAQVLASACIEARGWPVADSSRGQLAVAVNLSSRQFEPGDLPAVIERTLHLCGLGPESLHLELTETTIMDLHPNVLEQLLRIRDLGVEIGLDDFGTGYASLTHLRRLPLTFVKIDQSFVQGLEENQEDERIVSAVIELASNLGLRSIAEGVETKAQLERLQEFGCDEAQGYLFARPLPAPDVATAIAKNGW